MDPIWLTPPPGREPLDSPDLVLLCDPTGEHALVHAGSRVRPRGWSGPWSIRR